LVAASVNRSWPDAAFSVNSDLFSELAFAMTRATVAASPLVASAMSEELVT
jgi:hypothetical protein